MILKLLKDVTPNLLRDLQ